MPRTLKSIKYDGDGGYETTYCNGGWSIHIRPCSDGNGWTVRQRRILPDVVINSRAYSHAVPDKVTWVESLAAAAKKFKSFADLPEIHYLRLKEKEQPKNDKA